MCIDTHIPSTSPQETCPTPQIWVCGFSCCPNCSTAQSRAGLRWRHLSSLVAVGIYNEHHNRCRDKANLISRADLSHCRHSAERSLPLHEHGAAHCGSVYPAHTCTLWLQAPTNTEPERERDRRKRWLVSAAGILFRRELPSSPLRQERVHRDPTEPPPRPTPDRGARLKTLHRPYHTSHNQAPPHDKPPTLSSRRRGSGGGGYAVIVFRYYSCLHTCGDVLQMTINHKMCVQIVYEVNIDSSNIQREHGIGDYTNRWT